MKRLRTASFDAALLAAMLFLATGLLSGRALAFDYPEPGDFALGAQQWAENCARCHNIRNANELRDDQWITTMFHMRVRAGLTGQETRNILTFLQESNDTAIVSRSTGASTESPPSGEALSGAEIYGQTCIACHGADGRGVIPGVPDFTQADGPLSKPMDVLLRNVTDGVQNPGSPMAMPSKGGNSKLTDADVRSVIDYLLATYN